MVIQHGLFEDLRHRAAFLGGAQQFGRAMNVVGAHHDVHVRGLLTHEFTVFLGQTASHDDLATFASFFPRLQPSERAVQLVVGVLTDTARVQHHHVRFGFYFSVLHTVGLKKSRDSLGIVRIHLAAEGTHVELAVEHEKSLPTHEFVTLVGDGSPTD